MTGHPQTDRGQRPPRLAVALVSLIALAYEVLLMRLFSIIQWHHFAYMIISLALLGYGASGTFLTLIQHRLLSRYPAAFTTNLALFGISTVACFALAQRIPFTAEEVLWDWRELLRLTAIYLLLAVPFFFAANCVALSFARYRGQMNRIYAADLAGAGIGSLAILALLYVAPPATALRLLSLLGLLTAAMAWWTMGLRPRSLAAGLGLLAAVPLLLPHGWTAPILSPYKGLVETLRLPGATVAAERSSPLGWLAVVESPQVPLRHAPGLSLNATREPPPQLAVFTDGGGMTVINQYTGETQPLAYLNQMTSALPYRLAAPERVLVLGAGGGTEVLQALINDARHIDAVELNPQMVELVRDVFRGFAGDLYNHPRVRVHVAEARGFVAGGNGSYDLIQLALLDSFAASAAGLYALSESYLYTVEAMEDYLGRLQADGTLAITRWIKLPPRDALKLVATAAAALRRQGVGEPGRHLALIRGWQTSTLLVKNQPLDAEDIAALKAFSRGRSFDLAWYPGIQRHEVNRYNLLPEPLFYQGARALLGPERERFLERYKYDLEPARDDRPYFFQFLKWRTLPEILELRGRGGAALIEWGYPVLVATLLQAAVASVLLIVFPLLFLRRRGDVADEAPGRGRVFGYFAALGLAFLFLEIAFMQKLILFLHHPLYAAAAVLSAFLVFAGLGSGWSQRHAATLRSARAVGLAVAAIAMLASAYAWLLPPLFTAMAGVPLGIKVVLTIALIAPLAFCMGMPFPLGLAQLGRHAPHLVPWAWAVNGCASVLSAVLASLLAIHLGLTTVVAVAVLLYAAAAASFPRSLSVSQ